MNVESVEMSFNRESTQQIYWKTTPISLHYLSAEFLNSSDRKVARLRLVS